jgi:chemotaxis receptor (MCP) glutamine deamidase CheD
MVCYEQCPVSCKEGISCRNSRKYLDLVFPEMLSAFNAEKVPPDSLRAELYGGGSLFRASQSRDSVGASNAAMARSLLQERGIPISIDHTGGRRGRRVVFRNGSASVVLLKP